MRPDGRRPPGARLQRRERQLRADALRGVRAGVRPGGVGRGPPGGRGGRGRRRAPAGPLRPLPPAPVRARRGRPAARRRVRDPCAWASCCPPRSGPRTCGRARAGEPPRGRRHPRQARRARAERRPDPLVHRGLHPRRRGARAGLGPADGDRLAGHDAARAGLVDRRDDPLRDAPRPLHRPPADGRQALDGRGGGQGLAAALPARGRVRGGRARSCPAAGSATPAAPSTSWRRSPASARTWRPRRSSPSSARWGPSSAPPARTWRRPTASSTRCAT